MLRLRQIALATNDLPSAERQVCERLGLDLCHRDPNLIVFGLENALFPIGDQFLELVTPIQADTTAGRLLDKRGGDAGYMVLFQVEDLGPVEKRLETAGIRVVYDAKSDDIRGLHLHPKDVPGAIVSVDAAAEPAEWPWAGYSWRENIRLERASSIRAMTVTVPNPQDTIQTWGTVLGIKPTGAQLVLDDAVVDFRSPTNDGRLGITHIGLATNSQELKNTSIDLLGVTICFV